MDKPGQNNLSGIPSYVSYPQAVFKSIKHYRQALASITRALARSHRGHSANNGEGSFLFDHLVVEFSHDYEEEEVFFDHVNSKVIVRAPKRRDSGKTLQQRRLSYLGLFSREFEAMRVIGITHIYLSLSTAARKAIETDD